MKHRTLTVFLLLAALLPVAVFAQTITGPDGNEYNANDWNKVEAAKEANGLKDEHVHWEWIGDELRLVSIDAPDASLTGKLNLADCTELRYLDCGGNQLTSLNVSGCTALYYLLGWGNNQMTTLDVSGCTALWFLACADSQLKSLDLSGYTALTYLYGWNAQLTSLNVSGCTELEALWCDGNQLTSLDVSGFAALRVLGCHYNELTSLRVSQSQSFDTFHCHENPLPFVEVVIADTLSNAEMLSLFNAPLLQGMPVEYAWSYDDETDVDEGDYTFTDGGFKFHGLGNGDVIYCEMTCEERFPGLTLRTTPLAITGAVTLPPTLPPGADIDITLPGGTGDTGDAGSVADNIVETSNGVWEFTFNVTVTYADGSTVDVPQKVEIPKNGSGEEELGNGYFLVYDIKGNGKNVKELKIVKKEN